MLPGSRVHVFRPSIIDVEASGFGDQGYPIEVGVAMASGERYSTLILPAPEWTHWDKEAEKVHRVTRETLKKYGRSAVSNLEPLRIHWQLCRSESWKNHSHLHRAYPYLSFNHVIPRDCPSISALLYTKNSHKGVHEAGFISKNRFIPID